MPGRSRKFGKVLKAVAILYIGQDGHCLEDLDLDHLTRYILSKKSLVSSTMMTRNEELCS